MLLWFNWGRSGSSGTCSGWQDTILVDVVPASLFAQLDLETECSGGKWLLCISRWQGYIVLPAHAKQGDKSRKWRGRRREGSSGAMVGGSCPELVFIKIVKKNEVFIKKGEHQRGKWLCLHILYFWDWCHLLIGDFYHGLYLGRRKKKYLEIVAVRFLAFVLLLFSNDTFPSVLRDTAGVYFQ